jgi:hypothetical protein
MTRKFNPARAFLALILCICCLMLPSCSGGGGFSSGPPVLSSAGGVPFFLFPVKTSEGEPYYVGGSTDGSVAVQWKQSDGTTALLVKPKRGDVVFYIDGKRIGAKEPSPVIPDGVVIPESPPKTQQQAKEETKVEKIEKAEIIL